MLYQLLRFAASELSLLSLASRQDERDAISAGQIVLSGSFIRPVETSHGSLIEADFGKFGHVSCRF